jgi:uncharacterized membrane protein
MALMSEGENKTNEFDPHAGRALDRLINFSDAVVAVAITVLVLPLADIAIPQEDTSVWMVLNGRLGEVITFLFTFFVVAVMWRLHNRIFNVLVAYDMPIFWLNMLWLAVIVFLPVTSSLYGVGKETGSSWSSGSLSGAGLLYWLSLAAISGLGTFMAWHVRKNPHLVDARALTGIQTLSWHARYRGAAYAGYFVLIGVVSLFAPEISAWMPLGLIPLGRVMRPES